MSYRLLQLAFALPALVLLAAAARAQCETDRLAPAQGAPGGEFGAEIALRGSWAAIAARKALDERGAVTMFERVNGQWVERQTLLASDGDANDDFGYQLAFGDGRLVVGAIGEEEPHGFDSGAAYVFELQGGAWIETQKIVPAAGGSQDSFGVGLDMDGPHLLIGATGSQLIGGQTGVVHAYEWNGTEFVETGVLAPSSPSHGFGWRVDVDGFRALVSSGFSADVTHVYELVGGTWTETASLTVPGSYWWWGNQIALEGATALIASAVANSGDDRIYVFEEQAGTWTLADVILPHPGADGFATNVCLRGDRAWFGAFAEDELGFGSGRSTTTGARTARGPSPGSGSIPWPPRANTPATSSTSREAPAWSARRASSPQPARGRCTCWTCRIPRRSSSASARTR